VRPALLDSVLTFPGLDRRILAFAASDKAVDELVGDEPENERLLFGAIDTEVRAFLKVLKANILRNNAFS